MTAKKVLIVEEHGFSRICSALLELNGFRATCLQDMPQPLDWNRLGDFGLAVVNYPESAQILDQLRETELPLLILSDSLNETLLTILKSARNCYFMAKPLDYEKFNAFVRAILMVRDVEEGEA